MNLPDREAKASPRRSAHRLHGNQGGYRGEQIPIGRILEELRREAHARGWTVEELCPGREWGLLALRRPAARPMGRPFRLYLSGGIHGDEPAGVLALLELLRQDRWPAHADLFLCPCLNPWGVLHGRREGRDGRDLNRDYRGPQTPEVRAHVAWLRGLPEFDLTLLLHEDWEADGFYLYELCAERTGVQAETIIQAVATGCPILQAETIDGWAASGGIVRPNVDPEQRPQWAEAVFLFQEKTDLSYTLEAPSDYPLRLRTAALVAGVRAALGM